MGREFRMMEKTLRAGLGYAGWIGAALLVLPVAGRGATDPGGVEGTGTITNNTFTITEAADPPGPEPTAEAPTPVTVNVGAGNFVNSMSLIMCEEGTSTAAGGGCDGTGATTTGWSDLLVILGGTCDATGACQGSLFSDPTLNSASASGNIVSAVEGLDAAGNNGVTYVATNANGTTTTWTVVSDPVPEPGTGLLMAVGIAGIAASSRRVRRMRGL